MEEFDPWSSTKPLHNIEGFKHFVTEGDFDLDEQDLLLYAFLIDPIYAAELLWEHPTNHEYGGLYRVHDYQYPLWRTKALYAGYACARAVGKTESIKGAAFSHVFRRIGENMLVTAPELIHLHPLTDAIEDRIRDTRLTREFLDTRGGKTGFTHKPFGVDFLDGTKIIGRIPRLTGTGVKGQHQPDLRIEEAQDFPEKGWIEVHESQPLDSSVVTPNGLTLMGHLEIGNSVIGANGRPVKVLDILDHEPRPVKRITFSDGSRVECDADHLWTVERKSGRWATRRTSELRVGDALPPNGVVQFTGQRQLWVSPYLLGVVLGDGCMKGASLFISTADQDLLDLIRAELQDDEELIHVGGYDYRLRNRGPRSVHTRPSLRIGLECEGVWELKAHEKLIPAKYFRASVADRLALLQGLVDTDGNIDAKGAVRFSSSSLRLRDGVMALARSLGGEGNNGHQDDKRGFRRMFTCRFRLPPTLSPARLPRKAQRVQQVSGRPYKRKVVAIETVGEKPMRCIEVDAEDGLYLTENFIPTHNTVEKDHTDQDGESDFTYWFYGVHSGARETGFHKRSKEQGFKLVTITRLQTLKWSKEEKEAAMAAYGGTSAPDYRRNILGEAGAAASPFFVMSRLMAAVDQDRKSDYNEHHYERQKVLAEDIEELDMEMADILRLPTDFGLVHAGMDVGLTTSPTVISLFSAEKISGRDRLKLIRVFELWRLRPKQIRECLYALAYHLGSKLKSFGMDVTGLGFPMFQELEDDEAAPQHLLDVSRGYFFNAAVPVGVRKEFLTEDSKGQMRDQYGSAVKEEMDPLSGEKRYVTTMPMIEASTRYVAHWIDTGRMLLPFDPDVVGDMQGETHQRVKAVGERRGKKPNAFHILDSMRAAAMAERAEHIEEELEGEEAEDVLDLVG